MATQGQVSQQGAVHSPHCLLGAGYSCSHGLCESQRTRTPWGAAHSMVWLGTASQPTQDEAPPCCMVSLDNALVLRRDNFMEDCVAIVRNTNL